MNLRYCIAVFLPMSLTVAGGSAQSRATATRTIAPTAYVLMTGVGTRVEAYSQIGTPGGKNLGVTAGLTVDFYQLGPVHMGVDVRGTYPFYSGKFVGEEEFLGGARFSYDTRTAHVIRPYADVQIGRGLMVYQQGGYLSGNYLYSQTASTIYGGGGGVELDLTDQFSLKTDIQAHHWETPAVTAGSVWSGQVSVGVAYRLFANKGPR